MPTPVSANFFTASGEWQKVTVNLLSKEEFYAKINEEQHNPYANSEDSVTISEEAFKAFNTQKDLWFLEDTSKIADKAERLAREEELKSVDKLNGPSVTEAEKVFNVVAEKTFESGTTISISSDVVDDKQTFLSEEDYIFSTLMYEYGDKENVFYNDEASKADLTYVQESERTGSLAYGLGYDGNGAHLMVDREHIYSEYIDKFNNRAEAFAQPKVNAIITYADGRTEVVEVTENTKFSEDENGNIIISSGDKALEATNSDDFLVAFTQLQTKNNNVSPDTINTGDGDDTLVLIGDGLLRNLADKNASSDKYMVGIGGDYVRESAEVNLGSGNKEIIGINFYNANITGEDGNYSIHGIQGSIELGNGNNTINDVIGTVNLGDGDNTVTSSIDDDIPGIIQNINITAGNGENNINIVSGNIAVGNGDNNIHVENKSYILSAGNGNNNIGVHTVDGIGTFVIGDGNNNINIHTYAGGGITENQNSLGEWVYSDRGLKTGLGNNQINIENYKLGSTILLNSGSNTLNIGSIFSDDSENIFSNSRVSSLSYLLTSAGTMIFLEGDNNKVTMYGKELSNYHFDLGKRDRRATQEEIEEWYY